LRWLPGYAWQRLSRHVPAGKIHLIIAIADHFEPAYVPGNGQARAPYGEQERRLDQWCKDYPKLAESYRDHDGCALVHTYFYPAEQYDRNLIEALAEFCRSGWGEIEVHLHHGVSAPDTPENTRRALVEFRDTLAQQHSSLSYWNGSGEPRYAFVHGNFALANSAGGRGCGVDSEMQILADTACYADMTLPAAPFHRAQTAKINSLYECALPLKERAPHRKGKDLETGRAPRVFPLIVQGPLLPEVGSGRRGIRIENAALTGASPPSISRLKLWKRASISVHGRPDWLFIKLHCHGMDVTQQASLLGQPMRQFLASLLEGAAERNEILHFVSAREMVNIILAACDGREGNPGDYRDYRLRRIRDHAATQAGTNSQVVVKG
jgi:hypothetical protein